MKVIITGGAGFIGSAVVRELVMNTPHEVVIIDKLGYASTMEALAGSLISSRCRLLRADICSVNSMRDIFGAHSPDAVIHLAAESHVDRSIDGPSAFIETNIVGTYVLLDVALAHWRAMPAKRAMAFRFHHVSTDEVFGSLTLDAPAFTELSRYDPRSPYSASKAASDHLVRAWHHTYGLPIVMSNCSNNYGPWQFPEKLIPLAIGKALSGQRIPVYGRGENVRDWIHVEDHARALRMILEHGRLGESYNVGSGAERTNIEIVRTICRLLDELVTRAEGLHEALIEFVADRPGHDFRYAMNSSKLEHELGWSPRYGIEEGLAATIRWYVANRSWWTAIMRSRYEGQRLGTGNGRADKS